MDLTHPEGLAHIEFRLLWKSGEAAHTDILHAPQVNFWRDCFPGDMYSQLMAKKMHATATVACKTDDFGQPVAPRYKMRLKKSQFHQPERQGIAAATRAGRFYPQGLLRGVPGVYPANIRPFRCTGVGEEHFEADLNHPLAQYPLTIEAKIRSVGNKSNERGGASTHWLEATAEGPGMQARHDGMATDFFDGPNFSRQDERTDSEFYKQPRMVQHTDDRARDEIRRLHGRLFQDGDVVLDLMASWTSHLPESFAAGAMTGLGMNVAELASNSRLDRYVVHDLNLQPRLPFEDREFDGVFCSVSVEYLVHPLEVFCEVARVLRPGGRFVVTFSNRWFPTKAIRIWPELHEFERMGLVLEYFRRSGKFHNLETYSLRGLPRPKSDKYYPDLLLSDPVYAVWGERGID